MVYDHIEQRHHVRAQGIGFESGLAKQRRGIYAREVELLFARPEVVEEVEYCVDHSMGLRTIAVHLVDHEDGVQASRKGFLRHIPGLRHGPFNCVDEQQNRVDHRQNAFDLTAKIGVTRGIHDIDAIAAIFNRRVFGQYRDATLSFELIAVHDPIDFGIRQPKGARLLQQTIDQGGLAVIDVGNNCDIAKLNLGH